MLNDSSRKVWTRMLHSRECVPFIRWPRRASDCLCQTGISAINGRVYAVKVTIPLYVKGVKVKPSRQIVTPFSMSPVRHLRRMLMTSMRCTTISLRSMTYPSNSYIKRRGFCFPSGKEILSRGNYPGVLLTYLCKREGGCFRAWNWWAVMSHPAVISTHGLRSQKKRNARMKDALEEALVLSHS